MTKPFVAIPVGSENDPGIMQARGDFLTQPGIDCESTFTYAHLAGVPAAHTTKPVSGVHIDARPLNGFDVLLSAGRKPAGIPVAGVAIGKTGAWTAANLVAQILAPGDEELAQRGKSECQINTERVQSQDKA